MPGDKLLLEREPWNAYDSAAVTVTHVRTGALLGYVPRGSNNRMKHEALFGTAVSCGPELKGGNWGATFEWRPILADLVLDLIPLSAVQSAAESAAAGEAAARTARVAVHGSAAIGSTAWGAAARAAGQVDLAAATSTDVARWLAEGWWEWLSRVSLREANDRWGLRCRAGAPFDKRVRCLELRRCGPRGWKEWCFLVSCTTHARVLWP